MYTLPGLVTPHGEFYLPLAEPTAERLADALLESAPTARSERLRTAVAADPVLAVWALVQAKRAGTDSLTTCTALAGWLASRSIAIFRPAHRAAGAGDESAPAEFAEPAGCSLAVAELAETFARHIAADAERSVPVGTRSSRRRLVD